MRLKGLALTYGFYVILLLSFEVGSQTPPPPATTGLGITVTHNQLYCPQAPIPIVETAEITDLDSVLEEVIVQISEGYVQGQDLLTLGGVNPNITAIWNENQGILTLSGNATSGEFETAIENVFFETTETVFTADRAISINLGSANFLPSTGHYYFYVAALGINWDDARDQAAQSDYFGLQGYLATITTPEEAQLAGEQSPGTGWIGGSDAAQEGVWRWVTGPEAGTIFWNGQANGSAPNGEFAFWNCNEPNNAGNEDYAHITDNTVAGCGGGQDPNFIGSWNDLSIDSGESDPSNPYYPKGYIVEYGGLPGDPQINLSASSVIQMPRLTESFVEVCGPGSYALSPEGNATDYLWYDSQTSSSPLFVGQTYTVNLTADRTFWISPRFNACPVGGRQPFEARVNALPIANNFSVTECDGEGDNDGITEFNLSLYNNDVAGNNLNGLEITHYEDVNLLDQIDSQSYVNQFNGQQVYAKILDTVTGCFSTATVELNVSISTPKTAFLEVCDDVPGDGFTLFDLSEADDQLISDPNLGVSITYYETFEDALAEVNNLPVLFRNTIPGGQTIYGRSQVANSCSGIDMLVLKVRPIPELEADETVFYCENTFPEPMLLEGGIVNGIPNNYYYNWSTGETTMAIEVNEPGIYTVEVTEVDGCSNLRTITVEPSDIAVIQEVKIEGSGEDYELTIFVEGSGDYDFAIQSASGPYQDSNVFQNVPPGVQTIYVRDVKANCGIVSKDISIIGYPKFFTPNGDGQNDSWGIKGFNSVIPFTGSVKVFDRTGKLLVVLNNTNAKWDGTYQGQLMPASDYWFIAELASRETFTGHFSLKR
jgi:gliding motility-associated-like protein